MQKLIKILILCISLNNINSQNNNVPILTNKENDNWILVLKNINDKSEQIKTIKEKIISDSVYLLKHNMCFNVIDYNSKHFKNKKIGYYEGKIGFILKNFKKYYILDIIENDNTLEILKLISVVNIDSIEINDRRISTAIKYGSLGRYGTILVTSTNIELKKNLKKYKKASCNSGLAQLGF